VPIAMWALAVLLIAPAVRFRTLYAENGYTAGSPRIRSRRNP
jgi:hypothetical protein